MIHGLAICLALAAALAVFGLLALALCVVSGSANERGDEMARGRRS